MHIPKLHWIVVEDTEKKTQLVGRLLSGENSCKIARVTHLNVRTTENLRLGPKDPVWKKNRGVNQRNLAIDWLREVSAQGLLQDQLHSTPLRGVVYFADDDNTYDVEVFREVCVIRM